MSSLMIPVLDGIAVGHARQLGAAAPAAGLPRRWRDHPELAAVFRSAPRDLRVKLVDAYVTAYDAAAAATKAAA